jgi:lipoprotein signal peptidase
VIYASSSSSSWQLVTAVRDEGDGLSLLSDSHEVMTALIVVLPIIVVVEISLQLHQASSSCSSIGG